MSLVVSVQVSCSFPGPSSVDWNDYPTPCRNFGNFCLIRGVFALYTSFRFRQKCVSWFHNQFVTSCNEVVAKVMFLLVSVILLTGRGWGCAIPACIAGGIPGLGGGVCSRGCLFGFVAFCYGLLLWPSGVAFWYGLLVWWPCD